MKYRIIGADRETAEDVEIIVEAPSPTDAEIIASRRNILVSQVVPIRAIERTSAYPAPPVPPAPALEPGHAVGAPSVNVHLPRRTSSLGVASLILGIVAFLFCWIPLLGIISTPLSALGLVLGIIGFLVAVFRRGAGIGYPIAGSLVSGFALFIAISMTVATGEAIDSLAKTSQEDIATNQQVVEPADSVDTERTKGRGPKKRKPAITWTSALRPVAQGDVQIRVTAARVGKVTLQDRILDRTFETDEPYLTVVVRVSNESRTSKLDFATWMGMDFSFERDYASLKDNYGNIYKRVTFGATTHPVGHVERASLYPHKSLEDVLVFEPPLRNIEYLRLELPAGNFGGKGMIRLQIPAEMIQW